MKCPHCSCHIQDSIVEHKLRNRFNSFELGTEDGYPTYWYIGTMECPACKRAIIFGRKMLNDEATFFNVYPQQLEARKAPSVVPGYIARDFNESSLVLSISPNAAAALSRRCLQTVLDAQGFKDSNLVKAIEKALSSGKLPTHIAENIDAIRGIGNFAAHANTDHAGEIVNVEPEEANWTLDILEELFDHFYVKPAESATRREAFNKRLIEAGKKPLNFPSPAVPPAAS